MALFPLQIGETTPYIVLAVIGLGVILVITILFIQKSTSTFSDDLTKQSRVKFEALTSNALNKTQHDESTQQPTTLPTEPSDRNTGYSALRKEVVELRSRLDALIVTNAEHLKKESETQARLEDILAGINEFGKRITSVEGLAEDIPVLKSSFLSAEEELRKVEESLAEQNLKVKQLDMSSARPNTVPASPIVPAAPNPIDDGRSASSFLSAPLAPYTRRCIYCGSALERLDRFCNRCGRRAV